MSTLAVIPARGGSRELPGKNLRRVGGMPLVAHSVLAALGALRVDRVLVSTDSPSIAAAARAAGAEVPFLRDPELATDASPTVDAVIDAVGRVEAAGGSVEIVVTLQPTSPFRTAPDIDAAIELMERVGADSAVSVASIGLPVSVLGLVSAGRFEHLLRAADARRQAVPLACCLTGGVYVTRRALLATGRLVGERPAALELAGDAALDIDTLADLRRARRIARRRARA